MHLCCLAPCLGADHRQVLWPSNRQAQHKKKRPTLMPRSLLHSWLWAPPLAALGRSGLHPLGSVLPQQIRTVRRCTLPMCPWTHASVPLHNRHANAGAGQPPLSAVHAQRVSALSGRVCTHCALAHREQLPHYILFPQTFATLDAFCLPPLGRVAHIWLLWLPPKGRSAICCSRATPPLRGCLVQRTAPPDISRWCSVQHALLCRMHWHARHLLDCALGISAQIQYSRPPLPCHALAHTHTKCANKAY